MRDGSASPFDRLQTGVRKGHLAEFTRPRSPTVGKEPENNLRSNIDHYQQGAIRFVIDCKFWAAALGYVLEPSPDGFDTWDDWRRDIGLPDSELGIGWFRMDPDAKGDQEPPPARS